MSGLDRRSVLVFVVLLRCGRLPFASQLGWLGLLRHGADIGQTQRESRAAVLPPPLVLLGKMTWLDVLGCLAPHQFVANHQATFLPRRSLTRLMILVYKVRPRTAGTGCDVPTHSIVILNAHCNEILFRQSLRL